MDKKLFDGTEKRRVKREITLEGIAPFEIGPYTYPTSTDHRVIVGALEKVGLDCIREGHGRRCTC